MKLIPTGIAAAALVIAGWLMQAPTAAMAADAATTAHAAEQPSQVIEAAASQLLKALDQDREAYRKDPAKIDALVDKYLLPHFDTRFAAQLVLGRYWRKATPQQRQRFIDAFYHSMLNTYGSALANFQSNMLKVFPTHVPPGQQNAVVRSQVMRSGGAPVSVIYYVHMTPQGWKAWDVHIDGISYVKSYREQFQSEIAQEGLDAVIKRLEHGEKPPQIGKTAGGGL